MVANLGYAVIVITFVLSIYGTGAAIIGAQLNLPQWVKSAKAAMLLTFPLITISALSLIYLLVNGHFEIAYVYNVSSNSMPLYLKITALWGGQSGSLLLWCWLLSIFASLVTLRKWDRDAEFLPWVIVVCLVTLAFFLGFIVFAENPFVRIWQTSDGEQMTAMFKPAGAFQLIPSNGSGLNPLLRHPGMIIHPPMLYLGFVSAIIPFAFAIASLITGRSDDRWIRLTRRWTLVSWLFLSLGLILGMRWAYDVLGWGGYWSWDPVEVAALMPWLSGTAFLHSVMIQEKRGLFKRWNMILIILTYSLVIFGTFLTRSGVFSSVHAFSESAIGPAFFIFIFLTFAISLGLLLIRWESLDSEGQMYSLLSREALFLVNNLLFMGLLVICFWGVIFPLISELATGQQITVGPPFYERATGPLFAALILLMGVAPLSAWGHSTIKTLGKAIWKPFALSLVALLIIFITGTRHWAALLAFWLVSLVIFVTLYDFWRGVTARRNTSKESFLVALVKLTERNRRRYGGYIVHLGVVIMALGIIGIELFQTSTQGTLKPGESLTVSGYTVTFESLAQFDVDDGRNVARAVLDVSKNGMNLGQLFPRSDYYYESQQSMTIPGVRSTLEDDLYIILADWEDISSQGVTFKIYHNPLVNWLWIGGFIFMIGILTTAWPDKDFEAVKEKSNRPVIAARQLLQ